MNMKQSCKALICAIEGELDGRHCTEEQAAAILDHALPSLTEALARVEAERDTAIVQMQNIRTNRDRLNKQLGDAEFNLCIAHQQLADVLYILDQHRTWTGMGWEQLPVPVHAVEKIRSKLAQAEQQEAQGAQAGEFWTWLDLAYRDGSKGEGRNFTKHNMEVAYRAGAEAARAALATQPAAAEPVAWITRPLKGSHKGRDFICEPDASLNLNQWEKPFPVYAAPPAAVHGDEAVMWEMLEQLRTATDRQALPGAFIRVMWEAGCDWINARAAMRAQAGEGEDHA